MKPIPELLVEQYRLGELSDEKSRELEQNPSLEQQLAKLRKSDEDLLSRFTPSDMAERIRSRMKETQHTGDAAPEAEVQQTYAEKSTKNTKKPRGKVIAFRAFATVTPILAAAALIITLGTGGLFQQVGSQSGIATDENSVNGLRVKGAEPELRVYLKLGEGHARLSDNSSVSEGDLIQLSYIPAGEEYGTIFSIDGNGAVTLHYPENRYSAPVLAEENGMVPLPYSYRLDNAPEFEQFFFVTSNRQFNLEEVLSAAREAAGKRRQIHKLDLPDHFRQTTLTLRKE